MDDGRQQKKYLLVLIAIIAIAAAAFCWIMVSEKNEQKKRDEKMDQLMEEARPYEEKIAEVQKLISAKEKEITINVEKPVIVVAFYVENEKEVRSALELAELNIKDIGITFLLNPLNDENENEKIINYIMGYTKYPYEIGIYGNVAEEGIADKLDILEGQLSKNGLSRGEFWFLSDDVKVSEYMQFLKDKGFGGYSKLTDYSLHINSGKDGEFYYIEYLPIKVGGTKIASTLNLCVKENRTSVMLYLMKDLAQISYEDMDSICKQTFEVINNSSNNIDVQVPSKVYAGMANQNALEDARREEFEAFKEEKNKEIEELKNKIDDIYKKWEE